MVSVICCGSHFSGGDKPSETDGGDSAGCTPKSCILSDVLVDGGLVSLRDLVPLTGVIFEKTRGNVGFATKRKISPFFFRQVRMG